jgi:hypothetical protein
MSGRSAAAGPATLPLQNADLLGEAEAHAAGADDAEMVARARLVSVAEFP